MPDPSPSESTTVLVFPPSHYALFFRTASFPDMTKIMVGEETQEIDYIWDHSVKDTHFKHYF